MVSTKEDTSNSSSSSAEEEPLPSFSLPNSISTVLDPSFQINSDYTYFQVLWAAESARTMIYCLKDRIRSSFMNFDNEIISKSQTLGEALHDLTVQLDARCEEYISKTSEQDWPLVEKFLKALGASTIQKKIFRHVLVYSSGLTLLGSSGSASYSGDNYISQGLDYQVCYNPYDQAAGLGMTSSIATIFNVSLPEIHQMTQASSILVKENMYTNNKTLCTDLRLGRMGHSTVSALIGYQVSLKQYQSIGSELLKNTMLDHAPFRDGEVGQQILKRKNLRGKVATDLANNPVSAPNELATVLNKDDKTGENNGTRKRDRLFEVLSRLEKDQNKKQKGNDAGSNIDEKKKEDMDVVNMEEAKENYDKKKKEKNDYGPYKTDLSYLEDQVKLVEFKKRRIRVQKLLTQAEEDEADMEENGASKSKLDMMMSGMGMSGMYGGARTPRLDDNSKYQMEKRLQKIDQDIQLFEEKISTKIAASFQENGKVFRLEQLANALKLCPFEKHCIVTLVDNIILPSSPTPTAHLAKITVGNLIQSLCSSLEEKMTSRKYFYKGSTLIAEGILTMSGSDFMTDLTQCAVKLDRRLFDYIVGLDTEMSELVNGSHLYMPDVEADDLVLPDDTKKRIFDAVSNYDKVKDVIYDLGIDKKITYGLAQILLFYGASGTGKTMCANALAKKLGVKVLLVNFPDLGSNSSGAIIKFLFREARINRALLFFDECESLFMSRNKGGKQVNMILTELERYDGLCILATNRAYDLDEAMHRRISLAVEFRKPDRIMREKIWKALKPPQLPLEDNVDFTLLASKFELVGGTVKNAWLQSIHLMIQRGGDKVTQDDLMQAASEQVKGQISQEDFDRRVVPTVGIDGMILDTSIKEALTSVVQYSKAQSVLFGQWGFDTIHRSTSGISVMLTGKPGTGKTMAAEAIGFDLGKPLLVVNVAELMSKWVGETGKNIEKIFARAKSKDAVLVFDEAEGLFGSRTNDSGGSTSRHDTLNVGLLLQFIENFSGICIVITNLKGAIDEAFFRRFRFVLEFEMPNASSREKIWKITIPKQCPLAKDVNFKELASRYETSGGGIKNAILRAATTAALRQESTSQVTMEDFVTACKAEEEKLGGKKVMASIYS